MTRPSLAVPLALAVLHLVLALVFASITPYRTEGRIFLNGGAVIPDIGAPDERQHANYVARIANGEGVAVFDPKDPNLFETYQAHQPPLYYFLGGAWAKILGADATGKDGGFRVRSLNAIVGAAGVVGVYFLALWGFRRPEIAGMAAAFAALLPMNIGLSGAVSNDPLLLALCSWCLAFTAKGVRDGWTNGTAVAVGLLAGLAILTKTTGVALLPILLFAALAQRPKSAQIALVALPLLVLVTPWWMRNQSLYGDPLAIGAFNQAFPGSAQAKDLIAAMGSQTYWVEMVFWWTARSLVGVFGYMDIWLTNTGTRSGAGGLYLMVLGMVAIGFLGWIASLSKAEREERRVHILNAAFLAIVIVLFIRFNTQYFQAQGRYVLPAIGPIACGVAYGLATLLKSRPALAVALVVAPLLLADAFAIAKLPSEFARRATTAGNAR
ncbi:MAG: phospholipid carrier-dependent glycosyltransferase [Fimbriimonas sp.]